MNELETLLRDGLDVGSLKIPVRVMAIICDSPARSFLKCIQGHSGKQACERCNIMGRKRNGFLIFYESKRGALPLLRTDASFRRNRDPIHHTGKSPLLKLCGIDMVKSFPLDYMHLVCLGVVKRLLNIWISIDKISKAEVDLRLKECYKSFPFEFRRKGRRIEDLCRWKAVEFRSFLLYSGPVVLKDLLSEEKYEHFMILHICMRILLSPVSTQDDFRLARDWLHYFVDRLGILYGANQLCYNVHSLKHFADDCIHFNLPLDCFSCFPFENYLGSLKRLIKGTRKPLAQLIRRLTEIGNHGDRNVHTKRSLVAMAKKHPFKEGATANSYCLIDGQYVIQICTITEKKIYGYRMNFELTEFVGNAPHINFRKININKLLSFK